MAGLGRWFAFAGTIAAGLYLFLILAVAVHEILGHGLAAILCGGRFVQFSVKPSFSGYAWHNGVPDSRDWIVTAAGNAANVVLGALAAALRWRQLSPVAFVLWLLMATNLGLALGYTVQGLVFGKGDAGVLAEGLAGPPRVLAIGIAAALLVAFAVFAVRRLVRLLQEQFQPASWAGRMKAFLLAVVVPVTVMLAVKPQGEIFAPKERMLSAAAGFVALLALGFWLTRRPPTAVAPGRPLRPWHALAMVAGAAAAYFATAFWLAGPVQV